MKILLWILQFVASLLYATSGAMKVFMFDKISGDVPSFGALPRQAWMTLGILELACSVGLIVPAALRAACEHIGTDIVFREAIVVPRTYELGIRDA